MPDVLNAAASWPGRGLDARGSLVSSMAASPGVYAVLLGSGMSTAAGIPTGWGIVQDLMRRIARVEGVDLTPFDDQPEKWWVAEDRPDPRYDTLVAHLARSPAARQALLRQYFESPPGVPNPLAPTAAHHALAGLVAQGRVRVVLTTNFDRLLERALDMAGVVPQVISDPSTVPGMTPLAHSPATVLKLHGDYISTRLRNTPSELERYPAAWRRLLAQVFDEYGLITVGWSADYDTALARALEASPAKRYPMYWAAYRGQMTDAARRLATRRQATIIDIAGGDEFFAHLAEGLRRLDTLAAGRLPYRFRSAFASPPPAAPTPPWAVLPLLQIRAAVSLSPLSAEDTDVIGPETRDRIESALDASALSRQLRSIPEAHFPADATIDNSAAHSQPITRWLMREGAHQSSTEAQYLAGGDASSGVSARLTVQMPEEMRRESLQVFVDLGISVALPLGMDRLAALMLDALQLASLEVIEALVDVIPPWAAPTRAELHVVADNSDGRGFNRPNDLNQRLAWSDIGQTSRPLGRSLGVSIQPFNPLTRADLVDIVVGSVRRIALDAGAIDPRRALDDIHASLSTS